MPRAGLTEARVIEEAERIADEIGLPRLTLAAVADHFGVRQPSLYKHIDGMDDLQRSISIRAKLEVANVFARAAAGRERGAAITAIADAYRAWAKQHPGRYAASQHPPLPDDARDVAASLDALQILRDVVGAYGLSEDDTIHAIRAMRSNLHGFITLEASGDFAMPNDIDRSYARLVEGFIVSLEYWSDRSQRVDDPL